MSPLDSHLVPRASAAPLLYLRCDCEGGCGKTGRTEPWRSGELLLRHSEML